LSSRDRRIDRPREGGIAGIVRATPRRGARSRVSSLPLAAFALAIFLASCGEDCSFAANSESLAEGRDGRTSVAFALNRRPVKLELYLRLDGGSALVELDHPDGRTTETFEVAGSGLREVRKEFDKEPGNWGLRVSARGGKVSYWAALHDRKKFAGPDEASRILVERTP
jgi:hypothetical protein